ncbi:FimV/HubP family polar landmark protein [Noviherbaspirillum sp.]|uniref:FimV/HubP family polar landmark protein n=1 Tax=Noviherbaspirillum sp. TaxID=1926288 RepID=UPI002B4948F9|nr:FimV/HubP family polar landmark protein [Noviherbaspirillum sp.]HJV80814.1 FimV/HubP family polar landmark protein [Noviherbaspirillum sp.]
MKTISAAIATALLFSNASAAGLGKLAVLSSLGQPLRAEIELTSVSKDEVGALNAKLASSDAFRQANIEFSPALMSLRFAVEQRGDRQFIRITSAQPLNEPFVDMLMELTGPNGRLIREYTFLLDPPDLRTAQSAQVAPAPAPSAARAPQAAIRSEQAPQSAPVQPRKAQEDAVPKARPVPQHAAEAGSEAASGEYRVRRGDTLAHIAGQVKPSGVSLDQMLVALYQQNPNAFVGQNMNRLRAGQILNVPSADTAREISNTEARNIIVAQAADFNNYRNRLAGQVAKAAPPKSAEGKQSAGGKITAKVEEKPTPASESKDKLKLSNAMPAPGSNAGKPAGAVTAEDKIAKDKAVAEANARVKELEKNVTDLQKLLEVKNKTLAEQQKQASAAKTEPQPAAPPSAASAPASAPAKPDETKAEKPVTPPPPPAAKAPSPVTKPKPAAPPPPPPEPSFFESLMENPLVLPGVGALLVALGALGIYRARRQKQNKPFEDSIITDSSLKANSLFGSTGGQSVDTNNSVFNSSFAPSASQLDTNEVDPVAEADVYIAYGRDAQAEEILKEALRTQPDRHAVRVKLLEIYSNRKDLRAFEVLATELYGLTKGQGEEWAQAAALGLAIDPNNPLYASGKEKQSSSDILVAPTQPLDEQGLATLLSSTQSDISPLNSESLESETEYFGNSSLAEDKPLELTPEPEAEPERKPSSNDLEFDLDGLGLGDMAVPNTMPRPAPAEPSPDLASIDFDFLDEPKVEQSEAASEPAAEATPEAESAAHTEPLPAVADLEFTTEEAAPIQEPIPDISLDMETPPTDVAPLEMEIPALDEIPASTPEETKAEVADAMDFDLSGISLELKPEGATDAADLALDSHESSDDSSTSAEMATKLDLAIAYQEIGDKEGARELLDEVLKGGTPEQSEKAKSLLLELA